MITLDGIEVQKGDKVWVYVQDGWREVVVREPYPWAPKFIVKARYAYASRKSSRNFNSIIAVLINGDKLSFQTLDHNVVHNKLREMGVGDDAYTLHFDNPLMKGEQNENL